MDTKELIEELIVLRNLLTGYDDENIMCVRVKLVEMVSKLTKPQQTQISDEVDALRNKLYGNLPTGDIHAFDLIKIINNHIKDLDALSDKLQQPTEVKTHADYKDPEEWDILDAMVDLKDSKEVDRDKELIEFLEWYINNYSGANLDLKYSRKLASEFLTQFRTQQNDKR